MSWVVSVTMAYVEPDSGDECKALHSGSAANLTTVLIQVRADFRDDFINPLALMSTASWNLCQRNEESYEAGFPDICWWEADNTFDAVKPNHVETIRVPADTLWYVRIVGDYKVGRCRLTLL